MDVKVGDKVIIYGSWNKKSIATVEKITPKGNYRLSNGFLYGPDGFEKTSDKWGGSKFSVLTPEMEEEFKCEKMVSYVLKTMHETKNITYEQAVEILRILNINEKDDE